MWPKARQDGYSAPTFLRDPSAHHREKIRGNQHVGNVAAQPLPHDPCLLGGPGCSAWGENPDWVMAGQNGFMALAFSGSLEPQKSQMAQM